MAEWIPFVGIVVAAVVISTVVGYVGARWRNRRILRRGNADTG